MELFTIISKHEFIIKWTDYLKVYSNAKNERKNASDTENTLLCLKI